MKVYTIKKNDVGRSAIRLASGKVLFLASLLGWVGNQDIGKELHEVKGVLYIENQEQYEKRINCK